MDKNRVLILGLAIVAGLGAYLFFKRNKQAKEKQEKQEEQGELHEINEILKIEVDTPKTDRAEYEPSLDPRAELEGVVPGIGEDEKVYKAWFTDNIIEREPIRNWDSTQGLVAEFVNYANKGEFKHMAACLDIMGNQFEVYMFLYALITNFYNHSAYNSSHPRQMYKIAMEEASGKWSDTKYYEYLAKYTSSIQKLLQIAPDLHADIRNLIYK